MSGRERYNGRGVPVLPPVKTIFSEVCKTYNLSIQELQILADRAGVTRESVTHLIIGEPVSRMDAEKVLSALGSP